MTLELAIRLTEILLGLVVIQQSCEYFYKSIHMSSVITVIRAIMGVALILGIYTPYMCVGLCLITLYMLYRFQGPYNGGSDRMGVLILICLTLYHFMPTIHYQELAFGYLAIQLILSYVISGWVKIINPQWRNGMALCDVFLFSTYPQSESMRKWAHHPRLLIIVSWCVIVFELIFPIFLMSHHTLTIGLIIAAIFHLANAFLFGLNRFFWTWIAAYPSIIWLQYRLLDMPI